MLIVLKGECVEYSSITRFIREFQVFNIIKPCKKEEKVNVLDEIDFLIKDVVDEEPFLSVRQIAKRTGIPKNTVFDRMTSKLGYISQHLKWIKYLITNNTDRDLNVCNILSIDEIDDVDDYFDAPYNDDEAMDLKIETIDKSIRLMMTTYSFIEENEE